MALGAGRQRPAPAVRYGLKVVRVLLNVGGGDRSYITIGAKELDSGLELALRLLDPARGDFSGLRLLEQMQRRETLEALHRSTPRITFRRFWPSNSFTRRAWSSAAMSGSVVPRFSPGAFSASRPPPRSLTSM